MAQEIRAAQATIPAGTPLAAPVTVSVAFPDRIVRSVRWRVPPGPGGLMGWQLTSDGVPVIPAVPGTWIVADDESDDWPLDGYPTAGNWQVTGYNTGVYPHTVYLTFLLDLITPAVTPAALAAAAPSPALGFVSGEVPVSPGG